MSQPNKTRVQVATDPAFSDIVHDVEGAYTTALQITEDVLPKGMNLYTRGMHGHPTTGDSSWSATVQFRIKLAWETWNGSANGLEYSLNSHMSNFMSAVTLSDTKVLVSYCNHDDNGYLYAVLLTIQGSSIAIGIPVRCTTQANSGDISAVALSDTKVLVCYCNNSNSGYLYAITLSIANDIITIGSSIQCNSMHSVRISAIALSSTKVFVIYHLAPSTNYIYSIALSISGSVISAGAYVLYTRGGGAYSSAIVIDESKVLVNYSLITGEIGLYSSLVTINGLTITIGSSRRCNTVVSDYISSVLLSSTKAIVCYRVANGNLYCILLTIANGAITSGLPVKCNDLDSYYITALMLSEVQMIICYRNISNNACLYASVININGDTINANVPIKCSIDPIGGWGYKDLSITKIKDNVFVTYNKGVNTTLYGKVLVG